MSKRIARRDVLITGAAAAATVPFAGAFAQDGDVVEIQMLNKHPEDPRQNMVFYPRVASVQPGQTVRFLSTDRGHNSASVDGMIPDAAEEWSSGINDDFEITFDEPGIYGYECTPHASAGMVGLIVVEGEGKLDNLEAAQDVRQRGRARGVWEDIWAEAEEMGLLEPTA